MKISSLVASLAFSVFCSAATAGITTVYQSNSPIIISSNSDNAFLATAFAATPPGSILVDFNLTFTGSVSSSADSNDFVGMWFGYDATGTASDKNISDPHTVGPNIGVKVQTGNPGLDLFVRNTGTGATFLDGSAITTGTSYRLFGHLYKSAGSSTYNRFDAWVNPSALELANLTGFDARSTSDSGISTINTFGIRSANLDNGDMVTITDLRIQAVPEPASLALIGLGLVGLVGMRRRKAI